MTDSFTMHSNDMNHRIDGIIKFFLLSENDKKRM